MKEVRCALVIIPALCVGLQADTVRVGFSRPPDTYSNRVVERPQNVLYDNGAPDGDGGYSNAVEEVFGARRTLLDDFVVDHSDGWRIRDFHWEHVWNRVAPGSGTGLELRFVADLNGTPDIDNVVAEAQITSYMEMASGNSWFARDGAISWVEFDPIELGPGTYWWEATIVGPDNNFWLTATRNQTSECWVNYADFNGLQRGLEIFGVEKDLNFILTGEVIPAPATLIALGFAGGLVGTARRRRRS